MRPWTAARLPDLAGHPLASMGPRPCGRGRHGRRTLSAGRPLASMGPRPCGRGRCDAGGRHISDLELQWGHGLAAVDGSSRAAAALGPAHASMGPRPCGRGRPPSRRRRATIYSSFNGATALRPWTELQQVVDGLFKDMLQWGHGLAAVDGLTGRTPSSRSTSFNGATALRPWTAAACAASRRWWPCFNGATALRPWTD